MGVMEHIITEGEEEAYQSEIQYRNAQSEFKRFITSAEGSRKLEFVSSILRMLALVALIVISIFRSRIVESIILGSAVMDEYKFVNPSTPPACVKAYSLPPAYADQKNFQPPTLPQNWGDKGAEGKQKLATQMTAWITMILIIITLWPSSTQYSKSVATYPHYQGYASPCTHLAQYSEALRARVFS